MAKMTEWIKIGRNETGQYNGELDYSISHQVWNADLPDLYEMKTLLLNLVEKTEDYISEKNGKTSPTYKLRKIIDLRYFPLFKKNYRVFPVKFGWKNHKGSRSFIQVHGWQTGWENGERIYGWTLHLGKLLIYFGKSK